MFKKMKTLIPVGYKIVKLISSSGSPLSIYCNGRHQKKLLYRTAFSFGLLFSWPIQRSASPKPVINEITADNKFYNKADLLFENSQYEECYQLLRNSQNFENVEVKWRLARVLYNMSKDIKYDKSYRKKLIFEAYDIISEQLPHHDDHFAIQKWYAILLDAKSSHIGISEKIKQLQNVKKHMDMAAALNPSDATILHMLGEWCFQLSNMPWHQRKIAETLFGSPPQSSYEDALEYFLKAEAVQPRFYSINLLRLGNCYLKLQKEDQAKYYLNLAASYPAKSNDDHQANTEATEMLKKLKT